MIDKLIRFCLENKLILALLTLFAVTWGITVAPFAWDIPLLPKNPIAVDAIPDIGENQQIVFTSWPGRSPKDVEDQVTYPLTIALLGVPQIRTVRSFSHLGFSSIYIIFKDDVDYYWSRSRVVERLASLPKETLPDGISPQLGPDATALGQVFWYTLEGRNEQGEPTGGWSPEELRSIQDWQVRYALQGVDGVAEVSSIGGFVKEYQIDLLPDAMRAYKVSIGEVVTAVKSSNRDVGARTLEINSIEYIIRGLGLIESLDDISNTVVKVDTMAGTPIRVKDIADVNIGPALRRGALDKNGLEAVGGVVVARYGDNPLAVIDEIKKRISEIAPSLPSRTLKNGEQSKLTIVPFYDRSKLIHETLHTLYTALHDEILATILVVVGMMLSPVGSILISGVLPLAVLGCFILMKIFSIDANIVALSGIAIAIGTMVDMGIVLTENIQKHLDDAPEGRNKLSVVHAASVEVGSAIITAVSTTIISFIPIFTMEAAEGKLFKPLAWTKTFSLFAAIVVSLTIIPPLAHLFLKRSRTEHTTLKRNYRRYLSLALMLLPAIYLLAKSWQPFGPGSTVLANISMTLFAVFGTIAAFRLLEHFYEPVLSWALAHKIKFLSLPLLIVIAGGFSWSGMHKEFMPPLDEGSFLYMPTTMPHASIGEALDQLATIDRLTSQIPEIENTVGKLGRTTSPLDPAPISMYENLINYKSEYITDEDGRLLKFRVNHLTGEFERNGLDQLIPDTNGKPFRQWRDHIKSPRDIWNEITEQLNLPGVTGASEIQPIAARLVMLQSGMRAPMGIKLKGSSQEILENTARLIEQELKQTSGVEPATVIADKMLGKPYIEIDIDREALARYGLSVAAVQDVIEIVLGGKSLSKIYEGRERYSLRVRYPRELRGSIDDLKRIIVPTPHGQQIPLGELADIRFTQQAEAIRSEDTALVTYITFDKQKGYSEIDAINSATDHLKKAIASGRLTIPAGVTWHFSGNYENQIRAEKKLLAVLPLALFLIFFVLYLQFRSVSTSLLVFSGIIIAWSGGFIMLWLYGQDWFLNFSLFGINFRELFAVRPYNLSTAVWVGFIALFGIASDDGVLIATYITQQFTANKPDSIADIRATILQAGKKRVRPALMTTATTIVALIPVLTSTGRGSDIMVPMAIPTFGGMVIALVTMFVVPVLYCWKEEWKVVNESK